MNQEIDSIKEKVNVVSQAHCQLIDKYNKILQEVEIKNIENEALRAELLAKQTALDSIKSELQQLRDEPTHQHQRITEMMTNLLKDLREIDSTICGDENVTSKITTDINHEEVGLLVAKSYIHEVKFKVKNLVQRCQTLKTSQADYNKKICEYEKELADCRLLASQYEARTLILTESVEEVEARERALEEEIDSLRKECEKLKAAKQAQAVNNEEKD